MNWRTLAPLRMETRVGDRLIALLLAGLLALQFLLGDQPGDDADALNLVSSMALAATLLWRRSSPLLMISAFTVVVLANEALGGGLFSFPAASDDATFPPAASLLCSIVAFFSLGVHAGEPRSGLGLAIGVAGYWTTAFISDQVDFGSFFFSALISVTPWLVGRNVLARNQRLAAARSEERQQTRLALANERARIARELHDVVAHSVGIIVVQADGARRVFDREPERAREALSSIEETARTALVEMRRSLGVLRSDAAKAEVEPTPSLERIDELIEQARTGGLQVDLCIEGERSTLPQGVDLSAYRIVQEALTNAIKHAGPAHARVRLRYGLDALDVEVADDGVGPQDATSDNGSHHGLVGMRERVASHRGTIYTGPGATGGFLVQVRLPLS